jgi:hypothetical protein
LNVRLGNTRDTVHGVLLVGGIDFLGDDFVDGGLGDHVDEDDGEVLGVGSVAML